MLSKIKAWLLGHRLTISDSYSVGMHAPIVQEDQRNSTASKIARTKRAFEQQEQQMYARALKSHRIDCDILDCDRDICFIREPDKVISRSKFNIPRKRRTNINMGKYENK